jgi:transcriptional regulator GlxA family with amidase domain
MALRRTIPLITVSTIGIFGLIGVAWFFSLPATSTRGANPRIADVVALATKPGSVKLYPALTVEPDATIASFDLQHPDGADYVVVPVMNSDDDAAALEWINAQAAKGAIIIGVCAGAKVVGNAGLLDVNLLGRAGFEPATNGSKAPLMDEPR